jgi:membrane-bound serine protease (ClpP class)
MVTWGGFGPRASLALRQCMVAAVALLLAAWPAFAGTGSTDSPVILTTRVEGTITPVIADHLTDGVRRAERERYSAYLVELDTPGGLVTSMREIVQAFLGSRVPVIVHVSPSGARAASAGTFITLSAHVAVMAPGTHIGAATPVDLQGGEITDKVINDMAAYAETVAKQRGRNVQFAVDTVRDGRAVASDEALRIKAIDLVAPDSEQLLDTLDGRTVKLDPATEVTLRTAGARLVTDELGLLRRLLQVLADPNLAFLFISIGTLAVIYELANPGMGLGGVTGAILLILGFFALSVLPVNVAGLALLALAAGLFAAELFAPGTGVFATGGAIALVLAGLFLFEGSVGVSLAVLLPSAAVVALGSLLAGRLALRARMARPVTGEDALIDRRTVVRNVDEGGAHVLVEGGWWTARGRDGPLEPGQTVRVVGVEDLQLIVEPVETTEEPS